MNNSRYPYIIHGCILSESKPFPTHTHGLNAINWPEFIIDPFCFGPKINGFVINKTYDYFNTPSNRPELESIINDGIILKLNFDMFFDTSDPTKSFCYRLVENSFSAVHLSYGTESNFSYEDGKVVQLWVDGDDFALDDEYYLIGPYLKGGKDS